MTIHRYLLVLFLTFLSFSLLAGGGWPQPKGKGYFKLSEWWVVSDQHYTDVGLIDPNITTGIFNTSLYAEYGFTDRLTGILYFPFFSRSYNNNIVSGTTKEIITPGEAINGIGDTDISIKYGISRPGSGLAVAATLTFGIPLGNDSGGSLGNLQLGDGEFNQILSLDAGSGWELGNTPFFANVNAGYNNRSKGFSDEVRLAFEMGANLFNKKVWLIGRLNVTESTKNGNATALPNATSIFANNSEFTTLGGEVSYNINDNWGFSVSATTAIRGEIIFASPSFSVGVFARI